MIPETELQIDTFRSTIFNAEVQMKILHLPTRLPVSGHGFSYHTPKQQLLADLETRLASQKKQYFFSPQFACY